MATKRRRGAGWHYSIRRRGLLPRPIYLSFADEAEGDRYVARLEALLDRGIVPKEFLRTDRVGTLAESIDDYRAARAVRPDDAALLAIHRERDGATLLSRIDYPWAERFVADLQSRQLAPGTIRHHVGALARCLDWCVRHGDLPANPLRQLGRGYAAYADGARVDVARERRLEPVEEESIRRVLAGGHVPDDRQRALVLNDRAAHVLLFDLLLETAMRLREVYTLRPEQIDTERRTIFLDRTKNGDKRQVPLSSVALAALDGWQSAGDYLLPFVRNSEPAARTTSRLSKIWSRVFEHAGCGDVRLHDIRHEATCRLFERTRLSDIQISLITGHRDPRMLRRYANLRGSDLAGLMW